MELPISGFLPGGELVVMGMLVILLVDMEGILVDAEGVPSSGEGRGRLVDTGLGVVAVVGLFAFSSPDDLVL